jgi:hypothetical protein
MVSFTALLRTVLRLGTSPSSAFTTLEKREWRGSKLEEYSIAIVKVVNSGILVGEWQKPRQRNAEWRLRFRFKTFTHNDSLIEKNFER